MYVGQRFPTGPRQFGDVIVLAIADGDGPTLDDAMVPPGILRVTSEYGVSGRFVTTADLHKDCETCMLFPLLTVPHDNCLYAGGSAGHAYTHCTADACY